MTGDAGNCMQVSSPPSERQALKCAAGGRRCLQKRAQHWRHGGPPPPACARHVSVGACPPSAATCLQHLCLHQPTLRHHCWQAHVSSPDASAAMSHNSACCLNSGSCHNKAVDTEQWLLRSTRVLPPLSYGCSHENHSRLQIASLTDAPRRMWLDKSH